MVVTTSHVACLFIRFSQFSCAAIVLGIIAYFINQHSRDNGVGSLSREIYVEVIAALSVLLSLIWMIPFTWQSLYYPVDFLISFAWFAAFGVLVNWLFNYPCGNYSYYYYWGVLYSFDPYCAKWRTAEAFSFIAGLLFLISAFLGIHIYHFVSDRSVGVDDATESATR
ncbi:hypothetical protein K432DRAFT_408810 [Lepidopterella palustris CBS 459.81]|uniref:MARVEL domain-containing protein n=1 Tax=Lepidopterella palustris CBS 459.81 TaxID=1314670 RepID=A0A8E2E1J4_9PEZI|nr:hypothetical protein K432DRAFT_408810 [Lepidopterella palustris CBS 459.81]